MGRLVLHWVCVCALGVTPLAGCSETAGDGGTGGTGGADLCEGVECNDYDQCTMDTCDKGVCDATHVADGTTCDDRNECTMNTCARGLCRFDPPVADGTACNDRNECTANGVCADGMCDATPVADGTACGDSAGACQQGSCRVACNEQGIRDAIAAGGGPYTFDCDGPTTVVTDATIDIYNDVILDGEGNLTVDRTDDRTEGLYVFSVAEFVTVELRAVAVTRDLAGFSIESRRATVTLTNSTTAVISLNSGTLTLTNSTSSWMSAHLGNVTVTNSTLSARGLSPVGASLVACGTIITLESSTVAEGIGGAPKCNQTGGVVTIANSVVVGRCGVDIRSNGYNIESPGDTCGFDQPTDQVNVSADDLNLGPLQDNGGPTMTHALGAGSVAIDVIPADVCEVDEDQRGEPRPETGGTMCDVGAFELEVAP